MEVVQALKEGRALIEKGWTQGAPARNAKGESCFPHSPLATSHCAMGAAYAATWDFPVVGEGPLGEVIEALNGALEDLWGLEIDRTVPFLDPVESIQTWNDAPGRSKNEVLRLWSRAIEIQKALDASKHIIKGTEEVPNSCTCSPGITSLECPWHN